MSPGPACRHTHTHISYFPFLFIRIAVGRGPLFETPDSVAIIGEHGGPPQQPASLPSRSRATILHLRMHLDVHRALSLFLARAQHRSECLPKMRWCLIDLFFFKKQLQKLSTCSSIRINCRKIRKLRNYLEKVLYSFKTQKSSLMNCLKINRKEEQILCSFLREVVFGSLSLRPCPTKTVSHLKSRFLTRSMNSA